MKLAGVSSVCHHCFGRKLWSAEKFTTTNGHANIAPTPSQEPNQLWATIMSSVERTRDIPSALCTVTAVCPSFFGFFRLLCVISTAIVPQISLNVPWSFKIQWCTSQPLLNHLHPSKMVKFDTGPWQSFYNVPLEWDQVHFVKKICYEQTCGHDKRNIRRTIQQTLHPTTFISNPFKRARCYF